MPKIHVLMVAAGVGSRFGADVPKQYLYIAGKTILQHAVCCLNHPSITDLTLVIASDDKVAQTLVFDFDKPIHFTTGGAERFLSVKSGVEYIKACGAKDDDWVLIHDAARPCLPMADLSRLIEMAGDLSDDLDKSAGAILATPVADTLKFAKDGVVCHTVGREHLYQAQTPQMFRLKSLLQMLQFVCQNDVFITDEASGFEHLGQSVAVVMGSRMNIKLTYHNDLPLFERLLG